MRRYLSESARRLIDEYLVIKVGSWGFPCPYFMNERGLRNLSAAYSGKGLPQEIGAEIERIYNQKKHTIKIKESAVNLMILCSLGVDCSGFVVNVLNEHLKETIGKSIFEIVKFPTLISKLRGLIRPRMNISAALLTGKYNSIEVQIADVQPGDMVRRGQYHVMLVEWVEDDKGHKKIGYIHSDTLPKWGVQRGEIEIVDVMRPLDEQKWSEKFDKEVYQRSEDKGLRRLRY